MRLTIDVYPESRKSFDDTDNPGNVGYLRDSAAWREYPESDEPISSVEVFIAKESTDWAGIDPVPISDNLAAAIATFINQHLGRQTGIDCYGFVNLVGNKPPHKITDSYLHWRHMTISYGEIKPGDVLCFSASGGKFRHAAVCVYEDLFLSALGTNSDLDFTTLEDLRLPYQFTEVDRLI
jgi:hypothetical protein